MCRWLAYSGSPVLLDELLYRPAHSLIDQSYVAGRHGIANAMQMTVATSDGERVWAFRYSTGRDSRSLFYSTDVRSLRQLHPENPTLRMVSDESRLIVSEPIGDLPGAWNAVPESMYGVIQAGRDAMFDFRPRVPA